MKKILIAGAGGQGIISLGKTIAYAAMEEGYNVSCLPSYGPEMRGGAANCSVIFGGNEITSPIISDADVLLALNRESLEKFRHRVKPGGCIIADEALLRAAEIPERPQQNSASSGINGLFLALRRTAERLGDIRSLNMVVLGALAKLFSDLSLRSVTNALSKVFLSRPELALSSAAAVNAGYSLL